MLNRRVSAGEILLDTEQGDVYMSTLRFPAHIISTISWEDQSVRGAWNILTKWSWHRRWQEIYNEDTKSRNTLSSKIENLEFDKDPKEECIFIWQNKTVSYVGLTMLNGF